MSEFKHGDSEPSKADFDPPLTKHTCKRCGSDFHFVAVNFGEGIILPADWCDACEEVEKAESAKREMERRERSASLGCEAKYEKLCPKWPSPTDLSKIPAPKESVQKVLNWQYGHKGMVLKGGTGQGKTRTIWLLLRRLMVDERRDVEIVKCVSLADELAEAAISSMVDHGKMIRRMRGADILLLDDFGKQRFTPRHDTDILSIIDERTEKGRPTLVTTRYDGIAMAELFNDSTTGGDVVRRLSEFCAVIPFGEKVQKE